MSAATPLSVGFVTITTWRSDVLEFRAETPYKLCEGVPRHGKNETENPQAASHPGSQLPGLQVQGADRCDRHGRRGRRPDQGLRFRPAAPRHDPRLANQELRAGEVGAPLD